MYVEIPEDVPAVIPPLSDSDADHTLEKSRDSNFSTVTVNPRFGGH